MTATRKGRLVLTAIALACVAAMSPSPPPTPPDPTPEITPTITPEPTPSVSVEPTPTPTLVVPSPGSPPRPPRQGTPRPPAPPRSDRCPNAGEFDFDGDGQDDAVVGDPFAGFGSAPGGRLFLLRGRAGAPLDPAVQAMDASTPGWIARPGHIDGDRCMDLVVANPFADGRRGRATVHGSGIAYVYWGGPDFGRVATRLELKPPVARSSARFGWSVAVRDGFVAIGAPYEDADDIIDSGAVYLFDLKDRKPGEPQRITQDSPGVPGIGQPGDMFGWAVTLGRLGGSPGAPDLAVGVPFEDNEDSGQTDTGGLTVVYDVSSHPSRYRGGKWDLPSVTDEIPPNSGDDFGYSLRYGKDGDQGYLAVGAPRADPEGVRDAGVVVLFEVTETGPRYLRTLRQGLDIVGDSPDQDDRFGWSVAISGPYVLVGAPGESGPTTPQSGAVNVVPLGNGSAGLMTTLDDPQPYDHFGWSVSAFGDGRFLIGAPDRGATGTVTVVTTATAASGRNLRELSPEQAGPAGTQYLDFGSAVAG
ncbi:FG-GAP repeat protein [Planotetraspora kaengkrachanensis]|uniref:VCBS repeat-containing protein n=1 Tax=Planotetraspora kaengkrachanensis TaxID=575193 RepID=A0A8J3LWV2_9ACTN|nr:FG-GAP repeat protein [Planotetraspora kaengkrachanensis]GIG79897.1 hypothetical protein Pka01_30240 [Planotetraspora kaengkrachanensis]